MPPAFSLEAVVTEINGFKTAVGRSERTSHPLASMWILLSPIIAGNTSEHSHVFAFTSNNRLRRSSLILPAPYPSQTKDPEKLAAYREKTRKKAQIAIFRKQPHAKVVVMPNATHDIFLSREAEVISQIFRFALLAGLPGAVLVKHLLMLSLCCDSSGRMTVYSQVTNNRLGGKSSGESICPESVYGALAL